MFYIAIRGGLLTLCTILKKFNYFRKEIISPVWKEYPVLKMDMLRPILALLSFNKVQEMILVELIVSDMTAKLDPTQYCNREKKNKYYPLPCKNASSNIIRKR